MNKLIVDKLFTDNMHPLWKYINKRDIHHIANFYAFFISSRKDHCQITDQGNLVEFFNEYILEEFKTIDQLNILFEAFIEKYSKTENKKEKKDVIVEFANSFGETSNTKKHQDYKSFKRYFGKDAVIETYQKNVMMIRKRISAFFRCLPAVLKNTTQHITIKALTPELLNTFFITFEKEEIPRIRVDILTSLAQIITALPKKLDVLSQFTDDHLTQLSTVILDKKYLTWEKCEALNILVHIKHSSTKEFLTNMLDPEYNKDIFVRQHSVTLLIDNQEDFSAQEIKKLLEALQLDPSPFVRKNLLNSLAKLPSVYINKFLPYFLIEETEVAVCCSAAKAVLALLEIEYPIYRIIPSYKKLLNSDSSDKVIRFALENLVDCFDMITEVNSVNQSVWLKEFLPVLEDLHCNATEILTRRTAAQTREKLWCKSNTDAMHLMKFISEKVISIKPGKSLKLLNTDIKDYDDMTIGRVLSVISQTDCSIELLKKRSSLKLIRNYKFKFRWWRFFYELKNSSPDKRQTTGHTHGRHFFGLTRSSSIIMSELSETKVPGEPFLITSEGNSRPYIPLVDEFISASDTSKEVNTYTPEGIATITPPKTLIKRFKAQLKLTFGFKKFADLRNWQEDFQNSPSDYINSIRRLGFGINITPYPKSKYSTPTVDPKVKRFFSGGILAPLMFSDFFTQIKVYFFSLYQNTLPQLTVFIIAVIAFFFGRHITLNRLLRKSRNAMPLVVGGWGTRGKSGTERIKAALFSSFGCSVVSKTTGCEAMFLYNAPFERTHEMFLFRPYEKATIWEQYNIFRLADKLDADVFLWECMALAPSYVSILQKHWMRDDFSTITNTYPDHEDIQGPAGWNIAETMTNFVPENGNLVTAEEQMFPFLHTAALEKNTKFSRVDWKDAILITSDILARFPYEEHPHNIALVLKIAGYLGISEEYGLKEMSDNVVPDIGVLKKFPVADVRSRQLEFLSGMSANERFGCMGNWTRMELDTCTQEKYPNKWITTVVNNRADRVSRSRQFATILVEDLSVDKHYIIGSNLKGMMGYIKEAWDLYIAEYTLWNETKDKDYALEQFDNKASFLRIPATETFMKEFLKSMLLSSAETADDKIVALWDDPDKIADALKSSKETVYSEDIALQYKTYHVAYKEYNSFKYKIQSGASNHDELNKTYKEFLWQWFHQKFVVVWNYSATGNQVIDTITQTTPPGIYNQIMALQNIKGTGLDFFYRWQAWEKCNEICTEIDNADKEQLEAALRELEKITHFEILAFDRIGELLTKLSEEKDLPESTLTLIGELKQKLEKASKPSDDGSKKNEEKSTCLCVKLLENFLDPGSAVRRRKKVDRVYRDLVKGRISYGQTIIELQKLNKMQKGGWLKFKKNKES